MGATTQDIKEWIERGKDQGATHVMVVCDTFDYDDYPVFVMRGQDARKEYDDRHGKNMQSVMEVYDLSLDIDAQLKEHRALHF